MELVKAKFLNNPKLVFSKPKSINATPSFKSFSFNNSIANAKIHEIYLSTSISQFIKA